VDQATHPLVGKVALVTGAASGIGRATAIEFARQGAAVALFDMNRAGLESARDELRSNGHEASDFGVDLSALPELQSAFDAAIDTFGGIDILINAAGVGAKGDRFLSPEDEMPGIWDFTYAINLRAPLMLMRRAAQQMIAQGRGGKIVNITSESAFLATTKVAYSSSKAALIQLTRVAAHELGPHDINVNCVAPGLTLTPMPMANRTREELQQMVMPGGLSANFFQRPSEPEDVANVIVFLCLPGSRQVTGQTIHTSAGSIT
jgi:NAD(P)-dependent dehydrogenase (short-subunit alcohol dehydrogenase family)